MNLIESTDWHRYGTGNNPKCNNCMAHCGYEGTAVEQTVTQPLTALQGFPVRPAHRRRRWRLNSPAIVEYADRPGTGSRGNSSPNRLSTVPRAETSAHANRASWTKVKSDFDRNRPRAANGK